MPWEASHRVPSKVRITIESDVSVTEPMVVLKRASGALIVKLLPDNPPEIGFEYDWSPNSFVTSAVAVSVVNSI